MTAAGPGLAWYAYAVQPPGSKAPLAEPILPGAAVEAADVAGFTVLASRVDRGLFDRADPANRTGEPDWIAGRIAAHHDVVSAAAGACLPLAFGALFSSLDLLASWLAPRRRALQVALMEVGGMMEWTLAMEVSPAHAAWLDRHDPALGELARRVRAAGEGTAFLMARQLDRARASARCTHLAAAAAEVLASLRAGGLRVLEEPTRGGLPGWSVLAAREAAGGADLHSVLPRLADRLEAQGLALRLAGPWPAYGFARHAFATDVAEHREGTRIEAVHV